MAAVTTKAGLSVVVLAQDKVGAGDLTTAKVVATMATRLHPHRHRPQSPDEKLVAIAGKAAKLHPLHLYTLSARRR